MTTELTKAAQQALEALEYMHKEKCDYMIRNNLGDPLKEDAARLAIPAMDALRRAITQHPAAQTEREAFEAWLGREAFTKRSDSGKYESAHVDAMWSAWQARASLPAPQQATPEPVGEVWGWAIVDKYNVARAIRPKRKDFFGCVHEDQRFTTEEIKKMDLDWAGVAPHRVVTLYTRPAPGVPEELRANVIEALREGLSVCMSVTMSRDRKIIRDGCTLYAQTEEWCRWLETEVGPQIRTVLDALAAAQAKGAGQ